VPPDLSLITDAAKRDTDKLSSQGAGDGLAQRSFTNPGRPYKAEDRAMHVVLEFSYGKKLDYALLDLFQAIMILVKDALGLLKVEGIGSGNLPWQVQYPFQIGPGHGVFR
jgi:hypothetical protein